MNQEPIFERVAGLLLTRLRGAMVPGVLNAEDAVKLAHPGADADYRFGVFLYDIQEVRPNGPPGMRRVSESEHQFPDRLLALHFLLYANRKVPFDSMDAGDEMILLEAAIREIHSMGALELDGAPVKVFFDELTRGEKVSLWQSLSSPFQAAAYLRLEPVPVPSARIRIIPPVREVSVNAHRKGALE